LTSNFESLTVDRLSKLDNSQPMTTPTLPISWTRIKLKAVCERVLNDVLGVIKIDSSAEATYKHGSEVHNRTLYHDSGEYTCSQVQK